MKARNNDRGPDKCSRVPARDDLSQWQRKYGKSTRDREGDGQSLEECMASAQAPSVASMTAEVSFDFDQFFAPANTSPDRDAADVIFQMNKILSERRSESPSIDAAGDDFEERYFRDSFLLGADHIGANHDDECLPLATTGDGQGAGNGEDAFAGESMALLFRRSHDENLLRKCFHHISSHAKQNKTLKVRVFSRWKMITAGGKKSEGQWVRRTRRRHEIRCLRRMVQTWLRISEDRSTRMRQAAEMSNWRTHVKVMTTWRRTTRREKMRKMEARERQERIQLAQRTNKADRFFQSKSKRACIAKWCEVTKHSKNEKAPAANLTKNLPRSKPTGKACGAVIEDGSSASVAQGETPIKTPKAKTTCITPERETPEAVRETICLTGDKENQTPNLKSSTLSCPLQSRQAVPLRDPSTNQGKQQKSQQKVLPKEIVPEARRKITCHQGSNRVEPPHQTSNTLLRPLKHRGSTPPVRHSSTPKMILDMEQRKQEREKRREQLRRRQEQKAIERQRRLEEERQRKEEAATKAQREFMQSKAMEEQRKRMASARWNQARRLAALHYRMSLQKRMLRGWRGIFPIMEFNERKVSKKSSVSCALL